MKKKITVLIIILLIIGFFGTIEIFHYTSEPEFCALCHPKKRPGPNGEVFTWEQSIHAKADVKCLDCHAKPGVINYFIRKVIAAKDPITQITHSEEEIEKKLSHPSKDAAPVESCLFCHTDDFNKKYRSTHFMTLPTKFLKFRELDYVVNPEYRESHDLKDIMVSDYIKGYNFSHKDHMENFENLRCESCHFKSFAHPDFRINYALKMKKTCFNCHEKEDGPDNNECTTCHVVQDKIRHAKIKGVEGDEDVMIDLKCTDCHKSFEKLPDKKTCIDCHEGDEEYGKTLVEWKTKIRDRLEKMEILYQKAKLNVQKHPELREKFKEAERIYKEVLNDRSLGVHNFEYINALLDYAEKQFKMLL